MLKIPRHLFYSYPKRTFKNFGHKREPTPIVTIMWHGFLTFGFIGLGIEWKRIKKFIFGDIELADLEDPVD